MTNKSALIVVDMQNDFIDGVLGSEDAQNIVPRVEKVIKEFDGIAIYVTEDLHYEEDYAEYIEGQMIPAHCISQTGGSCLEPTIGAALYKKCDQLPRSVSYFHKNAFGSLTLADIIYEEAIDYEYDTIYIVGLCTDICVISNALFIRAACPKAKVIVYEDCCAGSTYKKHLEALSIMESNCIEIKTYC